MSDDFGDEEEKDEILRLFGPSIVGRVKSGEIGVFSGIEMQNTILDLLAKAKNPSAVLPIKQIFEETKASRARAHKLDRLVSERIAQQEGSGTSEPAPLFPPPRSAAVVRAQELIPEQPIQPAIANHAVNNNNQTFKIIENEDEPTEQEDIAERGQQKEVTGSDSGVSKRGFQQVQQQSALHAAPKEQTLSNSQHGNQDDDLFVDLQDPIEYKLAERLITLRATVRLRDRPSPDADQVGLVTIDSTILVDGMTPTWFRVCRPVRAWALRASPDGQLLFQRKADASTVMANGGDATASSTSSSTGGGMVSKEEFEALLERVQRLEQELDAVRNVLRSV